MQLRSVGDFRQCADHDGVADGKDADREDAVVGEVEEKKLACAIVGRRLRIVREGAEQSGRSWIELSRKKKQVKDLRDGAIGKWGMRRHRYGKHTPLRSGPAAEVCLALLVVHPPI